MIKIIILLFFAGVCSAKWSKELKVRIEDGRILGRFMTSESGKTIRAFMGIPYAEPPLGDLRFRSPVRKKLWRDVLKTQTEPPKCLSMDSFAHSTEFDGQEDCLYLNVYAPQVDPNSTKRFPVMVYFHGGGWITGSGGYSAVPPEYFLDHDVILVSGNYRLGVLGFLSFEDAACPGNFGLKDQSMMLQWVKMNIDKFGGDSNKITIFGESAGSASVNYHSIAPISKGLFEQGILQSGTLMSMWSDPPRPGLAKMRAIRLTQMMDCPISNTNYHEMTKCLRKVDSRNLTNAMQMFYEWELDPVIPFPPVLEDFHQEDEAFISSRHYNKHAFDIPWMVGMTSEEGLLNSAVIFSKENQKLKDKMIREWDMMLPLRLYYDHLPEEDQKKITEKISNFYFNNGVYDDTKQENLTHLFSDSFFITGIIESLKFRLKDNIRENTFVYLLSHKGSSSFSEIFSGGDEDFHGTSHADDLLYLFPLQKTWPQFYPSIPSEEDRKLSKLMVKLWVNFATTGKPTPEWTKDSEYPYWNSARNFPIDYMLIGNSNGNRKELFTMEKGLYDERCQFWEELKNEFPMLTEWSFHKFDKNEIPKDEL